MKNLLFLVSIFLFSINTQAATIVVDSLHNAGYGSLRAAIDSASNGDTIRFNPNLIALGSDSIVLDSSIVFSKSLTFKGLYTPTDTLFISGGGTSRVFNISYTPKVVLDSLVIINGYPSNPSNYGGAVTVHGDSLIINNSIFRNNVTDHYGGAVYLSSNYNDPNLIITNSKFTHNKSRGIYGRGGAICIMTWNSVNSVLQIFNSVIKNNIATNEGGGVFCGSMGPQGSKLSIYNSTVTGNISKEGAGIYATSPNGTEIIVHGSTIDHNKGFVAQSYGAGVYCFSYYNIASIDIHESTIIYNKSDSCRGGGVYCKSNDSASVVNITNSTIAFNDGFEGGGIHVYSQWNDNGLINVKSSIIAFNGSSNIENNNNTFNSLGFNIFSDSVMIDTISTDQINIDSTVLNLGPLAFNGGFTRTMMPIFPSAAINNGNPLDSTDAQNVPIVGIREVGAAEVCLITYFTDSIVACDNYTWLNGVTYSASDTGDIYTLVNTAGCDSIVILNLSIKLSSSAIDTISTCNEYTWMDGNTYVLSNNFAKHTLTNAVGCDSIVTLHLTLTNVFEDTIVACDSYSWRNGITYTSSNFTARDTVSKTTGCDSIFALRLTIKSSTQFTDTLTACDSLTWINGITYYASNNSASHTLVNTLGCDSIVTLNLTINYSNSAIDTVHACFVYTWIDGVFYTSDNNTATHMLTNTGGCDSLANLNLSIHYGTIGVDTHVVCDSLIWMDGNTYYANNTTAIYTMIGGNVNGCDSVVTLNLTVNTNTGVDVVSACSTYTWLDGNTYTSNNYTATHLLTNVAGCDSLVTLNLTMLANAGIDVISVCESYTWNGITYTTSNTTALDTLVNAAGCDSIVTLDLTILNPSIGTDIIIACDSYTWNGITYTNSNTAFDTLVNAAGCDSIVILDLTITHSSSSTEIITACDSYVWLDGITYTTSTQSPTYIVPNTGGCDSIITLNLTITVVDTTITIQDLTLTAQATNSTYRWLDCDNNYNAIPNETNALFTVIQSGNYAVEVTQNGCVDTSACFEFTNVWIAEMELMGISLYPNPTSDFLHIDKGTNQSLDIVITNGAGAEVYRTSSNHQITLIDMSTYATGIYVVSMQNQDGVKIEQVVKR